MTAKILIIISSILITIALLFWTYLFAAYGSKSGTVALVFGIAFSALFLYFSLKFGFKYPKICIVYCVVAVFSLYPFFSDYITYHLPNWYEHKKYEMEYKAAFRKAKRTKFSDTVYSRTTIGKVIRDGDLEFLKALIESGMPVNESYSRFPQDIPLNEAAISRNFEVVKFLIANGAKAENLTISNERFSSQYIIEYLIAHGARDLREKDDDE